MDEEQIYQRILDLQVQKAATEKEIKNYKKKLDEMVVAERDPEVKIIYVPGYVNDQEVTFYIENKFPAYEIVSINTESAVATIKEREEFVPKKKEFSDGGQFYRRISKGRASIDLDQLQKGYPEIFADIVSLVPEIDENKVNERLEKDPDFVNVLEEVIKMESPSSAIVISKSKKDKE